MRNLLKIVIVCLIFSSCKKIENLNTNTKDPVKVSGESLFTGAQKKLFDQMVTPNVNYNIWRLFVQQWTETTYTDEAKYNLDNRSIPDHHWDVLYRDVLKNLIESKIVIDATTYPYDKGPEVKKNRLAMVEIMQVYTWSILVESFGNIPYSEAFHVENALPKYDDGLTIYKDLITRLNSAIANLNPSFDGIGGDNMYNGDVASWQKFANSLKLKFGMMLADIPSEDALARTTVETAVTAGVFTLTDDNAKLVYLGAQPNSNPIYDNLVASGRHDFVPANTFVDSLNSLGDPRRDFYFTNKIDTSTDTSVVVKVYKGGKYGYKNSYSKNSHVANKLQEPTFEGIILDYVEIEFYLAEAAERGYSVSGSAESHYNNAIKASVEYWGGDASAYLLNPRVAYTTAVGDYKQKIGMQKWIALYNRGFEAWTEWRRLDYPKIQNPLTALSNIPVRLTYPIAEQTLNGANYKSASAKIGGDDVRTKLFWDKTSYSTAPPEEK